MTKGDPESIRDFKRNGDLLKWIHKNGAMNFSVFIMHPIVDSIINAISLSFRPFDPKRKVSTIIENYFTVEPRFFELSRDRQSSSKNQGFEKSKYSLTPIFRTPTK